MPDICMCKDESCAGKNYCYRFMAKPDKYRQSYFAETMKQEVILQDNELKVCSYFYPMADSSLKTIKIKEKLTISGLRGD